MLVSLQEMRQKKQTTPVSKKTMHYLTHNIGPVSNTGGLLLMQHFQLFGKHSACYYSFLFWTISKQVHSGCFSEKQPTSDFAIQKFRDLESKVERGETEREGEDV